MQKARGAEAPHRKSQTPAGPPRGMQPQEEMQAGPAERILHQIVVAGRQHMRLLVVQVLNAVLDTAQEIVGACPGGPVPRVGT